MMDVCRRVAAKTHNVAVVSIPGGIVQLGLRKALVGQGPAAMCATHALYLDLCQGDQQPSGIWC